MILKNALIKRNEYSYQQKNFKEFGAPVSMNWVSLDEIHEKIKT